MNVRLSVTTSNFSSPTLTTLVMNAVEINPLEYTSYNKQQQVFVKQTNIITYSMEIECVCSCLSEWKTESQSTSVHVRVTDGCMCVLLPCHCQSISGSQHLALPSVSDNKGPCVNVRTHTHKQYIKQHEAHNHFTVLKEELGPEVMHC